MAPQFRNPAEVVHYMGAMQAQEYRLMRWAVAMRTSKPSHQAFQKAFDEGRIIRLHLMRGTWQLVSDEDYWPMIDLFAPKAIAVTKGWMSSNRISIPEEELMHIRDILIQTAETKGSATKEDFVQALAEKDLQMDDHRLSYHIRMAELSGILCSGKLHPMKATCRKGIELLGNTIHTERWKGRDFYLTDNCRTRGFRKGKFLLIPSYDEYLISYKSRDVVLPSEHRHRAHNNSGIFQPIIAHDGTICGNWTPFKEDCQATFFEDTHHQQDILPQWEAYKKFL